MYLSLAPSDGSCMCIYIYIFTHISYPITSQYTACSRIDLEASFFATTDSQAETAGKKWSHWSLLSIDEQNHAPLVACRQLRP